MSLRQARIIDETNVRIGMTADDREIPHDPYRYRGFPETSLAFMVARNRWEIGPKKKALAT